MKMLIIQLAAIQTVDVFYDGEIFTRQRRGGIRLAFEQLHTQLQEHYSGINTTEYRFPGGVPESFQQLYFRPGIAQALRLFDSARLPVTLRSADPDIYHPTYYRVPQKTNAKVIITIHDMIPELFSEDHNIIGKSIQKRKSLALDRSSHVIAVSENTKSDLIKFTDTQKSNITVVPLAPNPVFRQMKMRDPQAPMLVPNGEYLLYVGNRMGAKNFERLLRAFACWDGNENVNLVCAGGKREWTVDEQKIIEDNAIESEVYLLDSVSDKRLYFLYSEALAFVFPSTYEGFGIPPLEAMVCDTPVIAGHSASVPEVVGDAGIYVDPHDVDDIVNALERVRDPGVREELIEQGREQVASFTWKRTAKKTVDIYRKLI